jgi:hypothetical protein
MSLHITGPVWDIQTAVNNLLVSQATCSFSYFVRWNNVGTFTGMNFLEKVATTGFNCFLASSSTVTNRLLFASGNFAATTNFTPGVVYCVVLSHQSGNQKLWINGIQAGSGTSTQSTSATQQAVQIGLPGTGTVDVEFSDLAVYNGVALTATDALNLTLGTATPNTTSGVATAWWKFNGTVGNTPTIGDTALNDAQGNGYNFATLNSSGGGAAVYSAQIAFSQLINTYPILGRDLQTVYFVFTDTTALLVPQQVTAINNTPTFQVNGGSVSLDATMPLAWSNTNHYYAVIAYKLASAVQKTDAITYTAPFGWVTAGGQSAPAATNVAATNSGGALETTVGNWSAQYPVISFKPTKTMPVAVGMNWPSGGLRYGEYWINQNLLHRCGSPWTGAATSNSDGSPATVTSTGGTASQVFMNTADSNQVDNQEIPTIQGTYTFVADESNPGSPVTVSLSANANYTVGLPSISGTTTGKQWQWTVSLAGGHTNWAGNLTINLQAATGSTAITLSNMWLTAPGPSGAQIPNRSVGNSVDTNLIKNLTASNGKKPAFVRIGTTQNYASSQTVDYSDQQQPGKQSWNGHVSTINVISLETYNLTTYPNVYLWESYSDLSGYSGGFTTPTNTPGGTPTPYTVSPSSIQWGATSVNTNWGIFVAVTASPHGLKSGQIVTFPSGLAAIGWTAANSTTFNQSVQNVSNPVWVLNSTAFAVIAYLPSSTGQWATPTGQNTVNFNIYNGTSSLSGIPDSGTSTYGAGAAIAQNLGCGLQLALPYVSTEACCQSIGAEVAAIYPSGTIIVELGDEPWNDTVQGIYRLWIPLGGLLGEHAVPSGDLYTSYCIQANRLQKAFRTGYQNAGGTAAVKFFLGGQFTAPANTTTIMNRCSTYNLQCDYIGVAPYPGVSGTNGAGQGDSLIYGAATNWSMGSYIDLIRWVHAYDFRYWTNTAFTGMNDPGPWYTQHNALLTNNPVTGVPPKLMAYEFGLNQIIPPNTTGAAALGHDLYYHPCVYDLQTAVMTSMQVAGFAHATQSAYGMYRVNNVTAYMIYQWAGQRAGRGDGSDGLAVNKFATSQGGSPADGASHDDANVSPIARAWLDWIDGGSEGGSVVKHRRRKFFRGLFKGRSVRIGA